MKKFLFSLIFLLVSYVGFSQKGLSYQAVILDPNKIEVPGQDISGQPLINGDVWMKFSIYNGSTLQFEEVQKTKTDNYGLVNLLIGSVSSGSFNSLVWDGSQKSLQVFVSFDQGGSYTKISDQKLNYNPYALFAETAGKLSGVLAIANGGTGATTAADARSNLGLDQVNNTSDVAKPVSTATQAALDLKANASDVTTTLALKANTADMTAALAAKADTGTIKTFVVTQVAAANIPDTDASTKGKIKLAGDLAGTADAPTVPGLALKANAADVTTALALKANSSSLSAVATSGNYNDLSNKPTIPSAYALPKASASVLGGIKVGANLSIDANGVLSAAGSSSASSLSGIVPVANGGTGTTTVAGIKSVLGFNSPSVAIGDQAGQTNQGGSTVGVGGGAGATNQGGSAVAVGYVAGYNNQGSASVAIGSNAAQSGQGTQAVALGFAAGQNGQGNYSVAVGSFAGNVQAANSIALNATGTSLNPSTTGFFVAPIRNASSSSSLYYNTSTKEITYGAAGASGAIDLANGVTGTLPIAKGGTGETTLAGVKNTLGLTSSKLSIGSDAGLTNQGNNAIALGYNAGKTDQGASSIAIGYLAGGTATQGISSIAIGPISGGGGNESVAIGLAAWTGANNATAVGTLAAAGHVNSSAFGYQAVTTSPNTIQLGADGVTVTGSTAITNVRTSGSLTAGAVTYPNTNGTAGQVLTANNNGNASWANPASSGVPYTGATGSVNLGAYDLYVHGIRIGRGNAGLSYNTVVGLAALNSNTTGNYNNAFGSQALAANLDGYFNSAFGQTALFKNTSGYDNSAYGFNALNGNTTGSNNSAIGSNSLVNSTTGSGNSALGMSALTANTTGSNNTGVGFQSNVAANNLTNATAIGYGALVSTSNTIQLGNANVESVKTSGALIAGSVNAPIYASTPQTLTDGSTVVWNPVLGLNASVTLGGDRNLTFLSTPIAGSYGTLVVTQDATGSRTLNLPSVANKVLGSSSTTTIALSTAAGAKDIVNFYYDGTNYFWNVGQGYGTASTSSSTANLATGVTGTLAVANGGTGATTLTGYVKGTGTTSMTASATIPVADITGTLPVANGGTGAATLTGLIKGNGTSAMTAATAGTDYQAPIVLTTTGTGAATLSGTTLNIPSVSTVRLNSDEFTATAAQTSFTLTQTALNAKVFMFINGTRIKNSAFSVSGTTVTYTAANNNSYALVAGDRVQFDYAY